MASYNIKRVFVVGDKVRYRDYNSPATPDLFVWREGTAQAIRSEIVVVHPGGRGIAFTVPRAWVEAVVNDEELRNYLVDKIKLIAAQDQGCGGNMRPEECWRAAQSIARSTLAELGITV